MDLSVVIPAGRPGAARGTRDSLGAQTFFPSGGWEVLVVGPHVAGVSGKLPGANVRGVVLPRLEIPGRMRNAGAAEARGEWLLFVDDDIVLAPDFLAVLDALRRQAAASGEIPLGAIGPRLPGTAQTLPARLTDLSNFWSQQGFCPGDRNWLYSAALAVPAADFRAIGGFSPDLHIGEDVDLTIRLARLGRRVRFEPSLVAWHRHGRETFGRMWRYFWHNGGVSLFFHQECNHPRCFSLPTAWQCAVQSLQMNWRLNRDDLPELSRLLPGVFLNYLLFHLSVEWHHQSNLWQDAQFARLTPGRPSDVFAQQAFADWRAGRRWHAAGRYVRAMWLDLRDGPRR